MKPEEKELLIKDLCARLPYGVNGLITVHVTTNKDSSFCDFINGKYYDRFANLQKSWYDNIPCIKPYLRPMSSMTEEEMQEYVIVWDSRQPYLPTEAMDWLNAHHFDYRGLIEKGLALEASEDMYKSI